ncbi:MAG: hypothetical protein P4L31_04135 [Candidatus Babeliales bacterium]|nr:hypothetical protein [Candidatus Babeliales bacterium]
MKFLRIFLILSLIAALPCFASNPAPSNNMLILTKASNGIFTYSKEQSVATGKVYERIIHLSTNNIAVKDQYNAPKWFDLGEADDGTHYENSPCDRIRTNDGEEILLSRNLFGNGEHGVCVYPTSSLLLENGLKNDSVTADCRYVMKSFDHFDQTKKDCLLSASIKKNQ